MSKQIDELHSSQMKQTEEIHKELSEITALKAIVEKYLAYAPPPFKQREGKQTEAASGLTAEETSPQTDPPNRLNLEHITVKSTQANVDNNNNLPLPNGLSSRLTTKGSQCSTVQYSENGFTAVNISFQLTVHHQN